MLSIEWIFEDSLSEPRIDQLNLSSDAEISFWMFLLFSVVLDWIRRDSIRHKSLLSARSTDPLLEPKRIETT